MVIVVYNSFVTDRESLIHADLSSIINTILSQSRTRIRGIVSSVKSARN